MEYRAKGNDGSYTAVYYTRTYVTPGVYLVRMAGDDNHFPSPDTEITVGKGDTITVSFDSNGGSAIADATELACGDLLKRPADPTMPDANFLGWYRVGEKFDFSAPVTMNMTLTAGWEPKSIDFKLPAGTKEIGEAAFEGVPVKSVEIPASCTFIAAEAFKDCSALRQVLVLSADTTFSPTAFAGCKDVYIFAPEESLAKEFCTEGSGFIFVCLTK